MVLEAWYDTRAAGGTDVVHGASISKALSSNTGVAW